MKKTNILKVLMTLILAFVITGAFAQTDITVIDFDGTASTNPTIFVVSGGTEAAVPGGTSVLGNVITATTGLVDGTTYAVYNNASAQRTTFTWATADGDVTVRTHPLTLTGAVAYEQLAEEVYQTVNSTFRLYADPDPIYSPGYDASNGIADLNANSTWTWGLDGLTATTVVDATPIRQNWVELAPAVAGTYDITVLEENSAVACSDNGQTKRINVIAAPLAEITTADPATACGDQAAATVEVEFTEAVPAELAGYAFAVEQTVDNLSDLGATPTVTNIGALTATVADYTTAAKLNMGNDLTGAGPGYAALSNGDAGPFYYTFNTAALTVQNNQITRYTYTLIPATGAPAGGFLSAISQKSEYISNVIDGNPLTSYAFTDDTFIAIVVPQPQTGPIYHIPNDYAY